MMSTFALRLVHSDVSNVETKRDGDNKIVGHLLGVFVSLDTDRDSLINKAQLFQALQLVGLRPNESLLSRYLHAQAEDHGAASSAAAAVLAFKVSPSVFVKVTMDELRDRREDMWDDLDPLINFAVAPDGQSKIEEVRDVNNSDVAETISISQLRHLMVEVESPGKLSEEEWNAFLETAQDIIVDNHVSTSQLKRMLYNFDGDA